MFIIIGVFFGLCVIIGLGLGLSYNAIATASLPLQIVYKTRQQAKLEFGTAATLIKPTFKDPLTVALTTPTVPATTTPVVTPPTTPTVPATTTPVVTPPTTTVGYV